MTKRTKVIVGITSLVIVIAIGVGAAASRKNNAVQVRLEPVKARDLVEIVSASGWIRPHKKVDVQADIMRSDFGTFYNPIGRFSGGVFELLWGHE